MNNVKQLSGIKRKALVDKLKETPLGFTEFVECVLGCKLNLAQKKLIELHFKIEDSKSR